MKKVILGAFGTLALAAVLFSGYSFKVKSLDQLRAKALDYCTPNNGTDCVSGATENIYSNYEAVHI